MSEAAGLRDLIAAEFHRQAEQNSLSGYAGEVDEDGMMILDGAFDLTELAERILGREQEPVPGIVTGVPDGKPLIWSEYVHKKWMMNMNQRLSPFPKNNMTQAVKDLGRMRHRLLGRYTRAKLDIIISYPARFSADVHNYMPTAKAYVDGLIDIPHTGKGVKKQPARGIMTDDSDAYLAGPFLHPGQGGSDKRDHFRLDCILQPMK